MDDPARKARQVTLQKEKRQKVVEKKRLRVVKAVDRSGGSAQQGQLPPAVPPQVTSAFPPVAPPPFNPFLVNAFPTPFPPSFNPGTVAPVGMEALADGTRQGVKKRKGKRNHAALRQLLQSAYAGQPLTTPLPGSFVTAPMPGIPSMKKRGHRKKQSTMADGVGNGMM